MKKKRLVIYGGSFNPPGIHHYLIAKILAQIFDLVIVYPCGPRPDKSSVEMVSCEDRGKMVLLNFSGVESVVIDLHDIKNCVFTRNNQFDFIYKNLYSDYDVYNFVGGDILENGYKKESLIHKNGISVEFFGTH